MVKVVTFYIFKSFYPKDMGFFSDWGYFAHNFRKDGLFWCSLALVGLFSIWGISVDWVMWLWWMLFCGVYSQYVILGMLTAERYMTVFTIAFCVLIAKFTEPYPYVYTVFATMWFYRSMLYIKTYRNNEVLFRESMLSAPWASENANNLGGWYINHGRPDLALTPLLYSLKATPAVDSASILNNLCDCNARLRKYETALGFLRKAMPISPKDKQDELKDKEKRLLEKLSLVKHHQKRLAREGLI